MKMPNEKEPQTVIMDGKILDEALRSSGKSRRWLQMELEKINATLDNVFLGQVDSYGELTIDIYDDKLKVPSPQQRPLLMAMLKKTQADLESFSLETDCEKTKAMYKRNAKILQEIINKLALTLMVNVIDPYQLEMIRISSLCTCPFYFRDTPFCGIPNYVKPSQP